MATTEPSLNTKQVILKNLYRNGKKVPMMFRNGELIYQMLQKLVFEVDTTPIEFLPSGGTKTITITANDDWVMTLPAWLTASSISGMSSTVVTITATQQSGELAGEITITCGDKEAVIEVKQGEIDYSKEYLAIEALESGAFIIRKANIGYSINGGTWETSSEGQQLSLSTGDKVRFRYTMTAGRQLEGLFSGNTLSCKMSGNVMSLAVGDNFENTLSLAYSSAFSQSFYNIIGLTDASNVVMPATSITTYCYRFAFSECSNLVYGPKELPATTLKNYCYRNMFQADSKLLRGPDLPATTSLSYSYYRLFYNCSILNYIKCLATSIDTNSSLSDWVYGVQTTEGTFVKHPNATFWSRGTSGIPTNWTVEDADI